MTSPRGVARSLLTLIVAVGLVTAFPGSGSAALRSRKFQTPSGNIGCLYMEGALRCDIEGELKPQPQRDCDFDWAAIEVEANGKARPLCVSDTVRDDDAPTLKVGRKWKRNGITCRAKRASLRCHNRKHHGFFLSADDWDTF